MISNTPTIVQMTPVLAKTASFVSGPTYPPAPAAKRRYVSRLRDCRYG